MPIQFPAANFYLGMHAEDYLDEWKVVEDQTTRSVDKIRGKVDRAGAVTKKATVDTRNWGLAIGALAPGAEDFFAVWGTQGIAGGIRAASNNLSQFFRILSPGIGAFVGAFAGITATLGSGIIEGYFTGAEEAAKKFAETLKEDVQARLKEIAAEDLKLQEKFKFELKLDDIKDFETGFNELEKTIRDLKIANDNLKIAEGNFFGNKGELEAYNEEVAYTEKRLAAIDALLKQSGQISAQFGQQKTPELQGAFNQAGIDSSTSETGVRSVRDQVAQDLETLKKEAGILKGAREGLAEKNNEAIAEFERITAEQLALEKKVNDLRAQAVADLNEELNVSQLPEDQRKLQQSLIKINDKQNEYFEEAEKLFPDPADLVLARNNIRRAITSQINDAHNAFIDKQAADALKESKKFDSFFDKIPAPSPKTIEDKVGKLVDDAIDIQKDFFNEFTDPAKRIQFNDKLGQGLSDSAQALFSDLIDKNSKEASSEADRRSKGGSLLQIGSKEAAQSFLRQSLRQGSEKTLQTELQAEANGILNSINTSLGTLATSSGVKFVPVTIP